MPLLRAVVLRALFALLRPFDDPAADFELLFFAVPPDFFVLVELARFALDFALFVDALFFDVVTPLFFELLFFADVPLFFVPLFFAAVLLFFADEALFFADVLLLFAPLLLLPLLVAPLLPEVADERLLALLFVLAVFEDDFRLLAFEPLFAALFVPPDFALLFDTLFPLRAVDFELLFAADRFDEAALPPRFDAESRATSFEKRLFLSS